MINAYYVSDLYNLYNLPIMELPILVVKIKLLLVESGLIINTACDVIVEIRK